MIQTVYKQLIILFFLLNIFCLSPLCRKKSSHSIHIEIKIVFLQADILKKLHSLQIKLPYPSDLFMQHKGYLVADI